MRAPAVHDYAAKIGTNQRTLLDRLFADKVILHVQDDWSGAYDGTRSAAP